MGQYTTGTVTVTNGDATVTGVDTLFLTEVTIGDIFTVVDDNVFYEVASITNDLNLELSANYAGVTGGTKAYAITRDFTSPDNFPYAEKGDIETVAVIKRAILDIQTRFLLAKVLAKTATGSLVASESKINLTNEGAGGDIDLDLPSAVAGLEYTGMVQEANELKFTAGSGDTIRNAGSVSASAGNIRASTIGNVVTLVCINTGEWIVKSIIGTWTLT
jgi:hypothetical protein